jgi:lipopolysaccharide/colanic/teichoic acid biosynthesis glycosyltransferase
LRLSRPSPESRVAAAAADDRSGIQAAPEPHLAYFATKRALDIGVSLVVLLATSPIWFIAALAIVLESGRPVLFRQERLGFRARRFVCLKFRTMTVDAESRIAEAMHAAATTGPEFKRASDPRVTRLGRLLRAWSVDELPQFINVLRGEMSVVGPRPIAEWEAEYQGHGWARLGVKPGLTGTWQISGRSEISWERRMEIDVEYVEHRSLRGDLLIMLRTPWAILARRGAV